MLSTILIGLALQAAPATAKPADDKKICRSETATGSVMAKKICHTRAQWARMGIDEGATRDQFRDNTTNPGLPSLAGRPGS